MEGQPKVRPVKVRPVKVRKVKGPVKPKPVPKPVAKPKPVRESRKPERPAERSPDALIHLDPWKLDSSRVFHYGNALRWLYEMGVKQVGINSDWSIEIHTYDGRVEQVNAMVMVTRDRRFAHRYIQNKVRGLPTTELEWEMDLYDREFGKFLGTWKAKD